MRRRRAMRMCLGFWAVSAIVLAGACGPTTTPGTSTATTGSQAAPTSSSTPTGAITAAGRVTDDRGVPVAGAILDIEPLDGQPNPAIESIRRTTESGQYTLAIAPGRWTLTIAAQGFEVERAELDVPNDGTLVRDFALTRL